MAQQYPHNINPAEGVGPSIIALDSDGNLYFGHGPFAAVIRGGARRHTVTCFRTDRPGDETHILVTETAFGAYATAIGYLQAHGDMDRLVEAIKAQGGTFQGLPSQAQGTGKEEFAA